MMASAASRTRARQKRSGSKLPPDTRPGSRRALREGFGHRRADQMGARRDDGAGILQRLDLALGVVRRLSRQVAGMTHANLVWCGAADDERDDRLFQSVLAKIARGLLLLGAANLADQDDAFGLRILQEQVQTFDETDAVNGIAADTDCRRLTQADAGELAHHFAGERRRARCDADRTTAGARRGHDADLAKLRREDALGVRPDQSRL